MTGHYYNILLVVLCGLPGSGKSTLATRLQPCLNRVYHDCPLNTASWTECKVHVWSLDELIPQWHAPDSSSTSSTPLTESRRSFKQDRISIQAQVEVQLQGLVSGDMSSTCTSTSHILLIDDNMYYTSMRHAYYQLAQKCKEMLIVYYCVF
jgi:tRNA uridine 5-carbamoylmethylation protein Kti12